MKTERSATGIEGLDDILGGGFTPGRIYLIEGDPGSGKTTLAMQFLITGTATGEKGLYITLSESREELEATAKAHGWTLSNIEILDLSARADELRGDSQLTMFHPSEVELGETTNAIMEAVTRLNPARVVVDSLSDLRLLSQEQFRFRRQVLAFKRFFAERNCTVLLLDDRVLLGDDKQLQSIVHGVLSFERVNPVYGAERRRVSVTKFRASSYRGGFHDLVIRTGGLVVFPRLVAAEHLEKFDRSQISSGKPNLDELLGGGLDRGTSTLILGPAGTGKSTIALQYASAACDRGDHVAMFAFDEGLTTLRNRMSALGCRLKEGTGKAHIDIRTVDPAELSPGEFAHLVRTVVDQGQARLVIIDSLNGYLNSMPEEHYLNAQLHELLTYLARKGVTTILVAAQQGMMGMTGNTPIDTSYLADSVILLRFFEDRGTIKKAISVVKKRGGAHEPTIRQLHFDKEGVHISEPLNQFRGVLTGVPVLQGEVAPPR